LHVTETDEVGAAGRAQPRVTVISIFHNEERYLREAIDSVLAQDFRDFELLLVDDGSSDASSAVAREYAAREPERIRCLEHAGHANRGMSASRNLGLRHALGEFVAFIDADDRWRPFKLTDQVDLLDRMPDVDAVGGSVNYWASHGGGKDRIVPTGHVEERPIAPPEATLKLYPLGKAHAPSMSDLLFRRSTILDVGGFEEAFRGAYEDQAFLAKFYLNSTLYLTRTVWSDYRIHPASCMAKVVREGAYDDVRRSFLIWFETYLAGSRFRDDRRIRRALAKALRRYPARQGQSGNLRDAIRSVSPDAVVSIVRGAKAAARRLRPLLAPGPAILMYHRVAEESFDPWGMAISPANFADQLEWIADHRTVVPLAEFAECNRAGKLPRNAIALTFDDGYACNAAVAVPLLEHHRIPATIFVSPTLIDLGREFWWDELQRIVWYARDGVLRLDGHEVRVGEAQPDDDRWPFRQPPRTARQHAYHRLWSMLYERRPPELAESMRRLREQAQIPASPRESHRPLTPREARVVRSELIDFGSHALTHPSLPLLTTQEKAREIGDSVARCAELTGVEPRSFAYPYGNLDTESQRLVEQAGFLCACKADGSFVTRRSNRFALPRIFVGNWDSARLARHLGRP
jgi:glycosyltransferase involved in cell wall biosynthesis/peptidoglycan/xylan/chitin deacetylase (PgdA/CDA1 family)